MTDDRHFTGPEDVSDLPLLSGSATDFESSLLHAAKAEAPTEALSAKMLAPLATGAATAAATGGIGVLKWALSGASVLLVGGAYYLGDAPNDVPRDSRAPAPIVEVPAKAPPSDSSERAADQDGSPTALPPTELRKLDPAPVAPPSTPPPKKAPSSLADEMRLLDQARQALKVRKDPLEALRLLNVYESKYPSGALRPEATVLRVSALEQSGAEARAQELKSEFLKAHPESAHKKQLENGSP